MKTDYMVLCLRVGKHNVSPLGWRAGEFSKREIRRECRRFKNDSDVIGGVALPYNRLYETPSEMKKEIPEC